MSSPGSEARSASADPGQGSGQGQGFRPGNGENGSGQHRRSAGGRTPGAHRASKADGLIPGFGRGRGRPDRGASRGEPSPFPADVPSSGEAGLASGNYGLSVEGELAEAELARTDYGTANPTVPAEGAASPSLVRSSGVMALGTLASRVTGLVRSVVLVYAIGVKGLGNSYNYANTLPNTVYNLAIGGILTSVIVPLLVSAAKRSEDRGEAYDQRMFTLVTIALGAVTLVATVAAAPIATLYDPKATGAEHHLLVVFAYFFIPQIFFYGVSSLAGAILNARGHFAAPMWTPVVNNGVVTLVAIAFMVVAAGQNVNHVGAISGAEVLLLGIGTTLGIIAQTAALIPALRRVGFSWHPRFDFRRAEFSEIGRMAGWMFGYVLTTQVAFLVTSVVASTAGNAKQTGGVGAGFSAYTNAWLLFQLPYAIVAISVITALLPRMSGHASDRRYDLVQADFSTGVRLGSVVVAPAALVLAVLGPSLAEVLLGWGNTSDASARYLGLVFAIFSLGLMPYMLFQLLLRVLSRRIGGLAGRQIGSSLIRMHAAAVPAALFALAIAVVVTTSFSTAKAYAALVVVVGGAGALVLYVVGARLLRVAEVTDLTGMVRSRLRR